MYPSVPQPVVRRLSLYLREAERLADAGVEKVASHELARGLGVGPAQVRRDLARFGHFGRPGIGYLVAPLVETLRHLLGTDTPLDVVLVGVGDLGRALLRYKGFGRRGFRFVAAFDAAASKTGRSFGGVPVYGMDALSREVRRRRARLAIVAVPADAAQDVAERLHRAGVTGILNFAPTTLNMPGDVSVRPVDLAAQLEQLAFLTGGGRSPRRTPT